MTPPAPPPPSYLSPRAKQLWRDVLAGYELAHAELELLRLACIALDRADQARRTIRREGLLVRDRFDQSKEHPAVAIEATARRSFAALVSQLGVGVLGVEG